MAATPFGNFQSEIYLRGTTGERPPFTTDLAGSIYCSRLDGTERRAIAAAQGNLTGIAYAEI